MPLCLLSPCLEAVCLAEKPWHLLFSKPLLGLSALSPLFLESPELEVLPVQFSIPALLLLSLLGPGSHPGRPL